MALSEEQLELLGERLVPLFQRLESAVIADIARRLRKTGTLTETAELMAKALRTKGFSPAAIRAEVMAFVRADKAMQKEINENTLAAKQLVQQLIDELRSRTDPLILEAVEDAGNMAFNNDLEAWKGEALPLKGGAFERLVKLMQQRAGDEIMNLTKSMAFRFATGQMVQAQQAFSHALNLALAKLASGAYSYQQAMEETVRELARSGIRMVEFESGRSYQADVVVRKALLTSSAQLAGQISMQNVKDTGVSHVEVSAHWGARSGVGHGNHAGWQGKIYCVEGTDGQYENLEKATGYPSDPKGLLGYNCRHMFYPFWVGISDPVQWKPEPPPVTINGKTYTYYQATQQQRRMERNIRALKREAYALKAAGLYKKASEASSRARGLTQEYNDFSQAAGISPKPNRLRVVHTG